MDWVELEKELGSSDASKVPKKEEGALPASGVSSVPHGTVDNSSAGNASSHRNDADLSKRPPEHQETHAPVEEVLIEQFVDPGWWINGKKRFWHSWAFDYELFRKEGMMKYANWLLITWFACYINFIEVKGNLKGHENLLLIAGIITTFIACHRIRTHKSKKPHDIDPG